MNYRLLSDGDVDSIAAIVETSGRFEDTDSLPERATVEGCVD